MTGKSKEEGRRKKEEGKTKNARCPMPNAQCPMPDAQNLITNYQLPKSNGCRYHI
ncbi:MAG: hypothetical protein MUE44_09685 [Oscillatoriaceae cyanobacterium Prado104]|nr:hypothetical protein [Oscillatoriaceae cyanobacterium Prado104]